MTTTTSPTSAPAIPGRRAAPEDGRTVRAAIETRGLTKRFGSTVAVEDLDLTVPAGTVYGLLGPNGAGKSTALKMLTTLLRPSAGGATVMGHDLTHEPHQVRSAIGVAGQYASVDEVLTGAENLRLFARLTGLSRAGSRRRANELLEAFGLTDAGDRQVGGYSGGMRRRLDLAVSMVAAPPLVFLDEPTTGLDPRTREQMWRVVEDLVARGTTILLTTQYLEEADRLADRIGIIDHGRLVAEGTADELKDRVGSTTLVITPSAPADAATVRQVVSRTMGPQTRTASQAGRIHVPCPDAGAATDVLVALRSAGLIPAAVSVDRPSLDSVFLALTGDPGPSGAGSPTAPSPVPASKNQELQ